MMKSAPVKHANYCFSLLNIQICDNVVAVVVFSSARFCQMDCPHFLNVRGDSPFLITSMDMCLVVITAQEFHKIARCMRIIRAFGTRNQFRSFSIADRNFAVFSHIALPSQGYSWAVSLISQIDSYVGHNRRSLNNTFRFQTQRVCYGQQQQPDGRRLKSYHYVVLIKRNFPGTNSSIGRLKGS